ncbi:hypothetical protein RKD32_006020 [Streptomyces sp. SAI-195]|uniref:hypothetical protein n=1 Tax=Streptomyces TaxID=1883 RepID=UPI00210AF5C2|nr:hypothetical protein [Streptomyces coelicoflavus]MCQ4200838.1 hypothetical protein [Streptomyces coelicoflavus]
MPTALPTHFGVQLPAWVTSELADVPDTLPTDEDRILLFNRLAARNHQESTGGPFAALVVETETGRIRSAGVDLVLASGLSSTHAEVVAPSLAQAASAAGTWAPPEDPPWNSSSTGGPASCVTAPRCGQARAACSSPATDPRSRT